MKSKMYRCQIVVGKCSHPDPYSEQWKGLRRSDRFYVRAVNPEKARSYVKETRLGTSFKLKPGELLKQVTAVRVAQRGHE